MNLFQWVACKIFGLHTWTCKAEEGIKPIEEQLKSMKGFADYAKMYCKHCHKESKLNERLNRRV